MVNIIEATNRKYMRKFAQFPLDLYADCPYYVPAFFSEEMNICNIKKNPALEGCEIKCFLAERDGKIVGRVAGIIVHAYNKKADKKLIRFSRLDFIDDEEVSEALVGAVAKFGRERGMTEIHGPWDFNDTGKEGMQTSGYDSLGTFVTQYNYAYYIRHVERLGFTKEVGWTEYFIHPPKQLNPRITKIADFCLERYHLKEVEIKSMKTAIKRYAYRFFDVYNEVYGELYGTIELSPAVVKQTVKMFTMILLPRYLSIVVDENDFPVAMGVAISSIAQVMHDIKGKLFPFGFIKLLHAIKHPKRLELALVGISKEYRNKGLNAVMMRKIVQNALIEGVDGADTNPELETNVKVQALWDNFDEVDKMRTRQTYIMNL